MKRISLFSIVTIILTSCGSGSREHALDKKCDECIAEIENIQSRINASDGQVSSSITLSNCTEVIEFIEKYTGLPVYPMEPISEIRNKFEQAKEIEKAQ